jgi:regulator of extracellular matrix RemA (YlzA/DUF370 family)
MRRSCRLAQARMNQLPPQIHNTIGAIETHRPAPSSGSPRLPCSGAMDTCLSVQRSLLQSGYRMDRASGDVETPNGVGTMCPVSGRLRPSIGIGSTAVTARLVAIESAPAVPTAPASDNARLRHAEAVHARGGRRRRAFMLPSMKRLAVSTRDSIPPGLRSIPYTARLCQWADLARCCQTSIRAHQGRAQ